MNTRRQCPFLFVIAVGGSLGGFVHGATFLQPFVQYTVRDAFPEDGIADYLLPSDESGYIGQITGPGPANFGEETFLEFDVRSRGLQEAANLHFNFYYSDIENGTGKRISVSAYAAVGVPTLSAFGTGNLIGTFVLPSIPSPGGSHPLTVDVTPVVNAQILAGVDFVGFRLHDAMFNEGSPLLGIGTAQVALGSGSGLLPQSLELVPEPPSDVLACFLTGLLMIWSRR